MRNIAFAFAMLLVYFTYSRFCSKGCERPCMACSPRDCGEVQDVGFERSGVYHVTPVGMRSGFSVYCDLETDGGGWLVFQRRRDGSVDFYRGWDDYQRGFGDPTTEHWLGNLALHALTSQGFYQLRVELEDWEGNKTYAQYDYFRVAAYEDRYKLYVSGYSGNAGMSLVGDSLAYHDGQLFSTYDKAATGFKNETCPEMVRGAWWYNMCHYSNLNGLYKDGLPYQSLSWYHFKGHEYSLKATEMKIRKFEAVGHMIQGTPSSTIQLTSPASPFAPTHSP